MRMWWWSRRPISRSPLRLEPAPVVSTLVVSGKTPERVASTAGVLADWLAGEGADVGLADVAHTLNHHRARHAQFATVCARDRDQAVAGLRALAAGQDSRWGGGAASGARVGPGTVFVYSGQGSQWAGMGRQLLADEPAFAAAVAELEPVFVEQVGFSLRQVLATGEPVSRDCPDSAGAGGGAVGADRVVALLRGGTRCGDRAFDGGGYRGGGGRGAEPPPRGCG